MIYPISENDSNKQNMIEQIMDKHKATSLAHIHFLQPQPIDTKNDSVTLSNRARARLLRNQGSSVQEIANMMNLNVKTVKGYIGE